jgi:uncharacterized protein (TIGR02099 family)
MNSQLTKIMQLVSRWFWLTGAMLIIGTVIFIVIGRQTITSIDELRPNLQQAITDNIGMQVNLGKLQGEWPRLKPIIDIEKVELIAADQSTALVLDRGRANLDIFSTIKYRTPIWRELVADKLALVLVEDADGKWGLKGLSSETETDLRIISNLIFYSRLILLKQVTFDLQFFSGKMIQIHGDNVQLENETNFHRAELYLRISDEEVPIYALIEGQGDPGDLASFYADGYLQLEGFNISTPLNRLIKPLLPELFANLSEFRADASGEIWIDFHPGGAFDFEGTLAVSEVPLDWLADVPPVQDIRTELTGWYTPGSDWGTRLQGFDFSWSDADIDPLDLVFNQRLGSRWQDFDLSVNHLDLTVLTDLLGQSRIPSEQILTIIDQVRPQGDLGRLTLGQGESGYYASAYLDNIDMQPYKGAPGVKGLSGYIELNERGGLFHVDDHDGFDVSFPKVYRDYRTVDMAVGTSYIDWQPDTKTLVVRSEPVLAKMDVGTSLIMYSLQQQLPPDGTVPKFNLIVGGRDINAAYGSKYLPYKLPPDLTSWLKKSVLGGNVKEFGVLFRSGPPRVDKAAKTTQLLFDMEDTDINYHPDWPGMRDLDSLVLVDDGFVEGTVTSGKVGDASITHADAIYDGEVPPQQRLLNVDGSVISELSAAIDILAQSPLKKNIGALVDWNFAGQTEIEMSLKVPIISRAMREKDIVIQGDYQVSSIINDGVMAIPNSPLSANKLSGAIRFSVPDGLQADNISGQFWGQPLTAKLYLADGEQKVAFNTPIKPESLNQLIDFPWTEVISGTIPIDGLLSLPKAASNKPIKLQMLSQMRDVEVDFPQPLGKASGESRALDLTLLFGPVLEGLELSFGDKLSGQLSFSEAELADGLIRYDRPTAAPVANKLVLAAYLPTTDLALWQPTIDLFTRNRKQSVDDKPRLWAPLFDLQFDQLEIATFNIKDIQAEISLTDTTTDIRFSSELADGLVSLPVDQQLVPKVDLARLSLPSALLQEKIGQEAIDPRSFLAADFSIDSLSVGEVEWGSIAFEMRPEVSGAAFNRINGNLFGIQPGLFDDEPPTEFFWSFDGNEYGSRLVGPIGIGNIGDMFTALNIGQVADSTSGKMTVDLAWQDKPWNISRENFNGDFEINLKDGSFYKSAGGADAALKLVSLFNFANWLRRLQLDFSDVVGQNLAYNDLAGNIHFENGVAKLRDPLKMKMPSGRMSMAGDFNLIDETVDAQLVATLPVATNLPWVVALLGGLPAAAGVYVTSKLVEKQVDRLSSISYTIAGPWDNMEVAVDKIFAAELKNTASDLEQNSEQQPEPDASKTEQK